MTRQARIYKWFIYTLALLPVWWMDAYILGRYPLFGVTPLLLPVAVATVGVLEGAVGGAGFGLGVGFLWAAVYPGAYAGRILLMLLAGLATGMLAQYALAQTLLGCMLCSAGVLVVVEGLKLMEELFFLRASLDVLLQLAVPQLLWSLCWAPVIYALFRKVYRRVGGTRLA